MLLCRKLSTNPSHLVEAKGITGYDFLNHTLLLFSYGVVLVICIQFCYSYPLLPNKPPPPPPAPSVVAFFFFFVVALNSSLFLFLLVLWGIWAQLGGLVWIMS